MGRFKDRVKKRISLKDLKTQGQRTMAVYEELGNELVDLLDECLEAGRMQGGAKVVNLNPFQLEWWLDIPKVSEQEENSDGGN